MKLLSRVHLKNIPLPLTNGYLDELTVPKYVHWESKETALKFTLSIGWGRVMGQNWNDTLPSSQWAPIITGFDLMHLFVAKIEQGESVAPLWPQDDTYANISMN